MCISELRGITIIVASRKATPGSVKEVIRAAYRGGAEGLVLSRKYSETTLANLRAAGEVIRELGVG